MSATAALTGYLNDADQRYDPWQHLSIPGLFPKIWIEFSSKLPFGTWAYTHFVSRRLVLAAGMNAAEMRATLAHEIVHLERGIASEENTLFEEKICDLVAASRLISCADLNGLGGRVERVGVEAAAAELEVDEMTIEVALALEACIGSMINESVGSEGKEPKQDKPAKAARA